MDSNNVALYALFAAGVAVLVFVHRALQSRRMQEVGDLDDDPDRPRLGETGFATRLPWRGRGDVARFDLRHGIDSVVYEHGTYDEQGRELTPEIVYTRYSVIALGDRMPSLRAASANASAPFARLLTEMSAVDSFPSPEGQGMAFVAREVPHGVGVALWFQRLLDAAFARTAGEAETLAYLRAVAAEVSAHGAICARLLMTHTPELAAVDGLPQRWSTEPEYPDTALVACRARASEDDGPLFDLAMGYGVDGQRTDVMRAAWAALDPTSLTAERVVEALGAASPAVFADAAGRALAAGLPDVEAGVIRVARGRAGPHRASALALLGRLPSSETDEVIVELLAGDDDCRDAAARALHARGSTAASALLVGWLGSGDDGDVTFALSWLDRLGAPDAVGPLRALKDRWSTGDERERQCAAAIAGIFARTSATDGALTFVETAEGQLSVAGSGSGAD